MHALFAAAQVSVHAGQAVPITNECLARQQRGRHHCPLRRTRAPRPPFLQISSYKSMQRPSFSCVASSKGEENAASSTSTEDGASSSLSSKIHRIKISVQIYMVALMYIAYFFGASASDGRINKR
ncbi:hypothetical protein GOP47_0019337 [Adiantum capillus-veneris]|uniref:Uncharacterized protein n=1 Tax=Adiantum capillus-veneris TaxID=13818 RepID=A0A9D4Z8Z9_ADICA|nr:hypothetical protein GOP47_0019337 [Adiantum capillus-veneris]